MPDKKTMKAAVVVSKGKLEIQDRDIPKPGRGQVLVQVTACGVCKSDELVFEGLVPLPRVPGHEVVGLVAEVGDGVSAWTKGDRVGAGWYGGKCDECKRCRRGDFGTCLRNEVTGVSHDGGYAEYMVQPQEALARIPDGLTDAEAAPLFCAGITVYNTLRVSQARAGDVVCVQGVGGLGHLAIKYALKMGFRTVVLGRGTHKKAAVEQLGAHLYLDYADKSDPGFKQLAEWGGADVILSTAPAKAMDGLLDLLAVGGRLMVVTVDPEGIPGLSPLKLLQKKLSVMGWPSGTAADWEDTLAFSVLAGVRPEVEEYPLEKAEQAYHEMMKGKVGRIVLVPSHK